MVTNYKAQKTKKMGRWGRTIWKQDNFWQGKKQ